MPQHRRLPDDGRRGAEGPPSKRVEHPRLPSLALWAAAILPWLAGAAGFWALSDSLHAIPAPFHIPWWGLALPMAVSEMAIVHVPIRRQAHTFSLSEIPIVLGLLFASPGDLVLGCLVGSLIAFPLLRRQPPLKATFNVGQYLAHAVVALAVFHAVLGITGNPMTQRGWLAVLLAVEAASLLSILLIDGIMVLAGERLHWSTALTALGVGLGTTFVNVCLALLCATVAWIKPQALWLLVVPAAVVFAAYRVYTTQRQRHESLHALYEASRSLRLSPDVGTAVRGLLERARVMFRADIASITFIPEEGEPAAVIQVGPGDAFIDKPDAELDPTEGVWARVIAEGTGVLVPRPIANPRLHAHFSAAGIVDAMVVPLRVDDRVLGTLMVANRLGDVSTFDDDDLQLLETLANHASTALQNARLVQRLEESLAHLTEMNRMKDDFVASVSHELRTPLTSILGYVKTLLRPNATFADSDRSDFLQAIERQAERLRDLIEDLLIVSRIESAPGSASASTVDVRSLIAEVLVGFGEVATQRALYVKVDDDVPSVISDRGKLHQIISNLLDNAIKYSPPGEPIAIRAAVDAGGVTISVSDRGRGIPHELHERIFERFYQVDQSSTRETGGTGLGLYICRRLAELLGGRLWLEHSGPHGSTFSLWIPEVVPVHRGADQHRPADHVR